MTTSIEPTGEECTADCNECRSQLPESELTCAWSAQPVSECDCAACLGDNDDFEAYCADCWDDTAGDR